MKANDNRIEIPTPVLTPSRSIMIDKQKLGRIARETKSVKLIAQATNREILTLGWKK